MATTARQPLDLRALRFERDRVSHYERLHMHEAAGPLAGVKGFYFGKYQDVSEVLRSSAWTQDMRRAVPERPAPSPEGSDASIATLFALDQPPAGIARRASVEALRATTADVLAEMPQLVEAVVAPLLSDERSLDAVADIGQPLMRRVSDALTGMPSDAMPALLALRAAFKQSIEPGDRPTREAAQRAAGLVRSAKQVTRSWLTQAVQDPSSFARRLWDASAGLMTTEDALDVLLFLWLAACQTGPSLVGEAVHLLARRRDLLERLASGQLEASQFAWEVARLHPPAGITNRLAVRDTHVGGLIVRRGEIAALLIHAANLDPAAFPDPTAFLARRRRPLTFGSGVHHCLGAAVSVAAIEAVVQRMTASGLLLHPQELVHDDGLIVRTTSAARISLTAGTHRSVANQRLPDARGLVGRVISSDNDRIVCEQS